MRHYIVSGTNAHRAEPEEVGRCFGSSRGQTPCYIFGQTFVFNKLLVRSSISVFRGDRLREVSGKGGAEPSPRPRETRRAATTYH